MHVFPAGVGLMVMLALGAVVDMAPTTLTKPGKDGWMDGRMNEHERELN